ncbi:MAG: proline racemase family protein [Verrucomicrobiota bacterium]
MVIDSHWGGEPTRLVVSGGPDLGMGTMAERREVLREEFDWVRTALVHEPRGAEVIVGGVVEEPVDEGCVCGVIFFNNVGYLNMCGHGTMGLVRTLAYQGRIEAGEHRIETPVGEVRATLEESGAVTVENVASYRSRQGVEVAVDGYGVVRGDVAWGGNWFFLVTEHEQEVAIERVGVLTDFLKAVRLGLERDGVTGDEGAEIDHLELFARYDGAEADARNFVLCPGGAYDRSPCGTGTSAKLACLVADGKLGEGEVWRQAGVLGSVFEGRVKSVDGEGRVIPLVTGRAYVTGETEVVREEGDPFRDGV